MNRNNTKRALISISRKTFFQVAILLAALLAAAIAMTYLVPRGSFGVLTDGSGSPAFSSPDTIICLMLPVICS